MVMTTFPLIQGRPQIIILNHVSVYNRSVKNDRSLLLQASSSFTIELWEENIINSWVVGGFSPPIWKTCYTQIGNHFPNFSWSTFQKSLTPPPFVIPTPPIQNVKNSQYFLLNKPHPVQRSKFPTSLGGGKGAAASARAWRVKRLQPRNWTVRPLKSYQDPKWKGDRLPTSNPSIFRGELWNFGVVLGN